MSIFVYSQGGATLAGEASHCFSFGSNLNSPRWIFFFFSFHFISSRNPQKSIVENRSNVYSPISMGFSYSVVPAATCVDGTLSERRFALGVVHQRSALRR